MTNNNPKMQKRSSVRFTLPDLPRSQWCDMRRAYIENNLTLSELAKIYKCEPEACTKLTTLPTPRQ